MGNSEASRWLVRALAGLPAGPLRERQAARLLGEIAPERAAAALAALLADPAPEPPLRAALAALCRALRLDSTLPSARRDAIHRAAAAERLPAVVALFASAAPRLARDGTARAITLRSADEETLGHRTWRARIERSREQLLRLVGDDRPEVIRNLLLNPLLTESTVVRIAARRPVPAPVLEEVARSARWSTRHGVRRALVQNPYAPPGLAVSLLPQMLGVELHAIARDGVLHPSVRAGAIAVLSSRAPGAAGPPPRSSGVRPRGP